MATASVCNLWLNSGYSFNTSNVTLRFWFGPNYSEWSLSCPWGCLSNTQGSANITYGGTIGSGTQNFAVGLYPSQIGGNTLYNNDIIATGHLIFNCNPNVYAYFTLRYYEGTDEIYGETSANLP